MLPVVVRRLQEYIVAVVVVDAPVIMLPEFQQSFLFIFLEVPHIQFKIRWTFLLYAEMGTHSAKLCRTPSRSHRYRHGGRRSCELQRKLQQFPVGSVELCRKPPSFHRCSWVFVLRKAWFNSGNMSCDCCWVLLNVFPT